MRVLLVTSWGQPFCGIQSHSQQLIQWVQKADPTIAFTPSAEALDPNWLYREDGKFRWAERTDESPELMHLNWHRALHSRWKADSDNPMDPSAIRYWQKRGWKVVITFHDTFGENPPDDLSKQLCDLADAFIVHEPCIGLDKAIYWRMGVPEIPGIQGLTQWWYGHMPILGTFGFDFPWKNWNKLAEITNAAGWGLTIVCPAMTKERDAELRSANPYLHVAYGMSDEGAIATLHECQASAFTFTCANSGQSASILYGIAARTPVYAFRTCRQMRALYESDERGITWLETFEELQEALETTTHFPPYDLRMNRLAENESWEKLGKKYAELYRSLCA